MYISLNQIVKIFVFCLIVINLQIGLVSNFAVLPFNLPFASILVFAAHAGIFQTLICAVFFCLLSSICVYDTYVFWLYPIVAFIAARINPSQIGDKLLVCIVYNLIFTPIVELCYPHNNNYFEAIFRAILSNLLATMVLFFIVKLLFDDSGKAWFSKTR